MKLYEVFSAEKEDNMEWEEMDFGNMGQAHYTQVDDRQLHVEFAKLENIRHYLDLMDVSPLRSPIDDAELAAQSIIEEVPVIADQPLINVGMGIDMSPDTVNWKNMKTAFKVMGSVARKVLVHSAQNQQYFYIFGTNEHKKAKMFYTLIKRFASQAYFVENPEGASSYCFIIAKR